MQIIFFLVQKHVGSKPMGLEKTRMQQNVLRPDQAMPSTFKYQQYELNGCTTTSNGVNKHFLSLEPSTQEDCLLLNQFRLMATFGVCFIKKKVSYLLQYQNTPSVVHVSFKLPNDFTERPSERKRFVI
ncbi:unnamed protein product [Rhizopus stolonifer]